MRKTSLLYLIILVEGYAVLACELLAIRQLIPYVGSGTETTAIIISGVLLPLAFGYQAGGSAFKRAFAKHKASKKAYISVRILLQKNILKATAILGFGLSYRVLELFFSALADMGITQRLPQTVMYVIIFLVTPIFLLGQTVPLVSNYFSQQRLSEITGKMLFFSTAGSFLGSVFSTVVLMMTIGVHNTIIVTTGLLCVLYLLLSNKKRGRKIAVSFVLLAVIYSLNGQETMRALHIVSDDAYNTVRVVPKPDGESTILYINDAPSSIVSKDPQKRWEYSHYIENNFILPFTKPGDMPQDILVIGAGGFTLGIDDTMSRYTFVDIDPALKEVAEKDFLPEKLGPNKKFVVASARAFVHTDHKKYDLIILDSYNDNVSMPMETTTREYLLEVKNLLKEDGILVANIVFSPGFSDTFNVRYDNTFSSVFPRHSREIATRYVSKHNAVPRHSWRDANVLYIYFNNRYVDDNTIYTDDKNTFSIDQK